MATADEACRDTGTLSKTCLYPVPISHKKTRLDYQAGLFVPRRGIEPLIHP